MIVHNLGKYKIIGKVEKDELMFLNLIRENCLDRVNVVIRKLRDEIRIPEKSKNETVTILIKCTNRNCEATSSIYMGFINDEFIGCISFKSGKPKFIDSQDDEQTEKTEKTEKTERRHTQQLSKNAKRKLRKQRQEVALQEFDNHVTNLIRYEIDNDTKIAILNLAIKFLKNGHPDNSPSKVGPYVLYHNTHVGRHGQSIWYTWKKNKIILHALATHSGTNKTYSLTFGVGNMPNLWRLMKKKTTEKKKK